MRGIVCPLAELHDLGAVELYQRHERGQYHDPGRDSVGIVWCALVALPRFFVRTPLSPFNEHQWYLALPGVACVISGLIESRRLA